MNRLLAPNIDGQLLTFPRLASAIRLSSQTLIIPLEDPKPLNSRVQQRYSLLSSEVSRYGDFESYTANAVSMTVDFDGSALKVVCGSKLCQKYCITRPLGTVNPSEISEALQNAKSNVCSHIEQFTDAKIVDAGLLERFRLVHSSIPNPKQKTSFFNEETGLWEFDSLTLTLMLKDGLPQPGMKFCLGEV